MHESTETVKSATVAPRLQGLRTNYLAKGNFPLVKWSGCMINWSSVAGLSTATYSILMTRTRFVKVCQGLSKI